MDLDSIIRRERIEECLRRAPMGVAGGIANGVIAGIVLWSSGRHLAIALWLGAIGFAGACRLKLVYSRRRCHPDALRDEHDGRLVERLSLVNGLLWGGGIAIAGFLATPGQFFVLAALSGGMMGAGVLSYGTMARAALLFICPIGIGSEIAWIGNPLASPVVGTLLALNFLVMLTRGAFTNQAQFAKHIEAREELRDSGATIKLLLNEFEAQSSDWLWEADEAGRILAASPRFAEATGCTVEALDRSAFATLFQESPQRDQLCAHLRDREAFRNLQIPLDVAGDLRWWMLSARPTSHGTIRGVASDVTAQRRAEARVTRLAHFDELTELANRSHFNERLGEALARQPGDAVKVAILCVDLDRFKSVNDSLGHPIGDRLLCAASRRIERIVRSTDLVARLGGDEFAVMIEDDAPRRTADAIARRIVEVMREPFVIDEMQILTGASVGIAVAERVDCDAPTMLKRADLALYKAKALGRGQFTSFQ